MTTTTRQITDTITGQTRWEVKSIILPNTKRTFRREADATEYAKRIHNWTK